MRIIRKSELFDQLNANTYMLVKVTHETTLGQIMAAKGFVNISQDELHPAKEEMSETVPEEVKSKTEATNEEKAEDAEPQEEEPIPQSSVGIDTSDFDLSDFGSTKKVKNLRIDKNEIIRLSKEGMSGIQIARHLGCSDQTVYYHLGNAKKAGEL